MDNTGIMCFKLIGKNYQHEILNKLITVKLVELVMNKGVKLKEK